MATYYRPNLTPDQRDMLEALVKERLHDLGIDSPDFANLYRTYLKIQESKPFSSC